MMNDEMMNWRPGNGPFGMTFIIASLHHLIILPNPPFRRTIAL